MLQLLLAEIQLHNSRGETHHTVTIPCELETLLQELPVACLVPETGKYRFAGFDILIGPQE